MVAGLVAVSACAGSAQTLTTDRPPTTGSTTESTTGSTVGMEKVVPEDVAAHRARWESLGWDDYTYTLDAIQDPQGDAFDLIVDVRNGEVVRTRRADREEPYRGFSAHTIDNLLSTLLVAAENQGDDGFRAIAAFHPEHGYPVRQRIWYSGGGQREMAISDLVPNDDPVPDETTVSLVVSNQSFERPDVHITVRSGGATYVDAVFPVRGQHHIVGYGLPLEPGAQALLISTDTGAEATLELEVPDDGRIYVNLSYWADAPEDAGWLSTSVSDKPFVYG